MQYYKQNIPPTRDQRLRIGHAFHGNGECLVQCGREGCLLGRKRGFQQSTSCQMGLTLQMAATIPNSVIIMHSPVGCGSQLFSADPAARRGVSMRGGTPKELIWMSTNLGEPDVIGGGERKLREAIEYAERNFRPEIIFVVFTCAPSIIGDDIDEVVRLTQPSVTARLVPIHCPGFKTRVVATAYDSFYHALIKHLDFEPQPYRDFVPLSPEDPRYELEAKKEAYQKSRTVNLINASSIGEPDERELTRLLEALGLTVNVYTEFAGLDDFRRFSQAALNVSMCNVHDDYLLTFMQQKFGIPYIIHNMPLGPESTRSWLLAIAAHFGLEEQAQRLADYEEELVRQAIEPLLPKLQGKRVMLLGGIVRVAEEAMLLDSLGMEVLGVRLYHYDNTADPVLEEFNEALPRVSTVVGSGQIFELANILRREKPDIVVAHNGTNGWIAKLGIPSIPLYDVGTSFFGYSGIYAIVRRLALSLANTSYQRRLSQYASLPYKESWYGKDPYSYITE